jgi:hypothetical protein
MRKTEKGKGSKKGSWRQKKLWKQKRKSFIMGHLSSKSSIGKTPLGREK